MKFLFVLFLFFIPVRSASPDRGRGGGGRGGLQGGGEEDVGAEAEIEGDVASAAAPFAGAAAVLRPLRC